MDVLRDEVKFPAHRRLQLFSWITGRRALPDKTANMPKLKIQFAGHYNKDKA